MNQKKKYLIVVLALGIIGFIVMGTSRPSQTTQTVAKPTTVTLEQKIKNLTDQYVGYSTTVVIKKGQDTQGKSTPDKNAIVVTINAGENVNGINGQKESGWSNAANVFKLAFSEDKSINEVEVDTNLPTVNAYGKQEITPFQTIVMSRNTYDKIDWNNFDSKNIPIISDLYFDNSSIK